VDEQEEADRASKKCHYDATNAIKATVSGISNLVTIPSAVEVEEHGTTKPDEPHNNVCATASQPVCTLNNHNLFLQRVPPLSLSIQIETNSQHQRIVHIV